MPELPEVECLVRELQVLAIGQLVKKIDFYRPDLRRKIPSEELTKIVVGQQIVSIMRRSKYIILTTKIGYTIIHLGMTGKIVVKDSPKPSEPHTHLVFTIRENLGQERFLHYIDPRRFGSIDAGYGDPTVHKLLVMLGPEPLYKKNLHSHLLNIGQTKKVCIKGLIMNGHVVVGVGNIYACEALFLAGISPLRPANSLNINDYTRLSRAIQKVLLQAIKAGGTTFRDYRSITNKPGTFVKNLFVYGRELEPCRKCHHTIENCKISGRSSFYCPKCQH